MVGVDLKFGKSGSLHRFVTVKRKNAPYTKSKNSGGYPGDIHAPICDPVLAGKGDGFSWGRLPVVVFLMINVKCSY